jgi:hypothetical protein
MYYGDAGAAAAAHVHGAWHAPAPALDLYQLHWMQQQAAAAAAAAQQQYATLVQQATEAASGLCRAQDWQVQHPQVREALVQLCRDQPEVARAVNQPGVLLALERCMLLGGPAKALLVLHCVSLTQFSRVRRASAAALCVLGSRGAGLALLRLACLQCHAAQVPGLACPACQELSRQAHTRAQLQRLARRLVTASACTTCRPRR